MYTVYKTTCLVNNKVYVGVHKTANPNDDYIGSGKILQLAIAKYGAENFSKEILGQYEDAALAYAKEAEIVTEKFVADPMTYNIKVGGMGGWDYINSNLTDRLTKNQKARNEANRRLEERYGPDWRTVVGRMGAEARLAAGHKSKPSQKFLEAGSKLANTPEAIIKRKQTYASIGHQQGTKNSQFGKQWIYNSDTLESIRINKTDPIPPGWVKGRKMPNKDH